MTDKLLYFADGVEFSLCRGDFLIKDYVNNRFMYTQECRCRELFDALSEHFTEENND